MRPRRVRLGYNDLWEVMSQIMLASMRPRRVRLGYRGIVVQASWDNVGASMRPRRVRLGYMTNYSSFGAPLPGPLQ